MTMPLTSTSAKFATATAKKMVQNSLQLRSVSTKTRQTAQSDNEYIIAINHGSRSKIEHAMARFTP